MSDGGGRRRPVGSILANAPVDVADAALGRCHARLGSGSLDPFGPGGGGWRCGWSGPVGTSGVAGARGRADAVTARPVRTRAARTIGVAIASVPTPRATGATDTTIGTSG